MGQTFGTPDFDLWVRSVPASVSEVPGVAKIKIHNSNRSIWGHYQRMESYKLYRIVLSKYFYHGLNGQLCPEYFQKGPRNFFGGGKPLLRGCHSSPVRSGRSGCWD